MPMRVLFPTDGSTATEEAFQRLLHLFDGMHEHMTITVLNVTQEGFEGADPQYLEETYESDERDEVFPSEAASQRALDRCAAIAKEQGVAVHTEISQGSYVKEILDHASEHDVLAMHELRSSGLKEKFLGSATEKLVRKAPCSVLLVQTEELD